MCHETEGMTLCTMEEKYPGRESVLWERDNIKFSTVAIMQEYAIGKTITLPAILKPIKDCRYNLYTCSEALKE